MCYVRLHWPQRLRQDGRLGESFSQSYASERPCRPIAPGPGSHQEIGGEEGGSSCSYIAAHGRARQ